jgi:segregation and condensation protein B
MELPSSQLIHALLFTTGETWRFSEIQETLGIEEQQLTKSLHQLDQSLQGSALMVMIHNQTVTLATRPEYKEFLTAMEKAESIKEFSKGALETLALIAYKGPIAKSDIDYIRGVNSQFMLRNLVLRGMIEKSNTKNKSEYVITADALRYLGAEHVDQLPHYHRFEQEITKRLPVESSHVQDSE